MRFCSVWLPDEQRGLLCAVGAEGDLRAVAAGDRRFADVGELVTRGGGLAGLAAAAEGMLSAEPLGRFGEIEHGEPDPGRLHLLAPVRPPEVWAAGVTYEVSREARIHESTEADVYQRIYDAERPEIFFKATGPRVLGPGAALGLRGDSNWHVPEPELGLVLGSDGSVLGYTLGNDLSSRDIEGENPLYLPQAKIFAGACSLGPVVLSAEEIDDPYALTLAMRIERAGEAVFEDKIATSSLHVRLETLVEYLRRDNWLPPVSVLLTGTGIVPPDEFTLEIGDVVEISCQPIGSLRNRLASAGDLPAPTAWA